MTLFGTRALSPLARFARHNSGSTSVEMVIVLPILLWALAATAVFYDGFRARYHAEAAAQTVADVMSRETEIFSAGYVEGLTSVFDYLSGDAEAARMRVTSVIWDPENERNIVQWSYGSRGILPLPPNTFALLSSGSSSGLLGAFSTMVGVANAIVDHSGNGNGNGIGDLTSSLGGNSLQDLFGDLGSGLSGLSGGLVNTGGTVLAVVGTSAVNVSSGSLGLTEAQIRAMLPVDDLASRIPPVLPGEALLVIETFSTWTPFAAVGAVGMRFDPVVVVRPRFAPWINFEGVEPLHPLDNYNDIDWSIDDSDLLPPPTDPPPANTGVIISQDFTSTTNLGWSTPTVTQDGPTGRFLGPFGGETLTAPVTRSINLGRDDVDATISFDLLVFDDWDGFKQNESFLGGDALFFLFNGTRIATEVFEEKAEKNYGRPRNGTVYVGGSRISWTMTNTRRNQDFFGEDNRDQIWRVSMVVENAPPAFSFGFSASLDNDDDDDDLTEAFGIDNFQVATINRTTQGTLFTPPQSDFIGLDAITGIPMYQGCPDSRMPSSFVSYARSDLTDKIIIERIAGGATALSGCSNVLGWGNFSANPTLILNYDDEGRTTTDLLITGDDNDKGKTCDTVMIVRDPHGQWVFNDDYKDLNSGIRIPDAVAGRYEIWLGTFGTTPCQAGIIIDRK